MEMIIGLIFLLGTLLTLLVSLATVFIFFYTIYDVLANQQGVMEPIEQILWLLVMILFPVVGAIAYLVIVKVGDIRLTEDASERKIKEIEELVELKEKGAITEEEYEKLKDEIIPKTD